MSLQTAAPALLLLLLLFTPAQQAQAQGRPTAAATSWMPATTTASTGTAGPSTPTGMLGQGPSSIGPNTLSRRPGAASAASDTASSAVGADAATYGPKQPRSTGSTAAAEMPGTATEGTTGVNRPMQQQQQQQQQPSLKAPTIATGSTSPRAAAGAGAGTATGPAAAMGAKSTGVRASSAATNPSGSLHNVLAKNAPLFRSLLTVLDISPEQIPETAVGTLFVPTDDAISEFLQAMNLTAKQLASRPELVDLIVSYHFVPGYQVQSTDVAGGNKTLLTGDDQYILRIAPAAAAGAGRSSTDRSSNSRSMVLTDVQQSKANVVDGPFVPENNDGISVYLIDKVLRSANYFLNIESALTHSPYWISTKAAAEKANVLQLLEGQPVTMFVPDNAAFKPVEANLSRASTGRLADILKYHVLPKVRRIPKGFQSGPVETLLKGHSLDMNITSEMQAHPFSGNKNKTHRVPVLTITPEKRVGSRDPQVTYYNVFAGPAILHGINQVLLPDLPNDPNELPPPSDDEFEQPPDADVAEQAGPGSLDEANKEVQGEDGGVGTRPSASSQQGRLRPGVGMGQGLGLGAAGAARGAGVGMPAQGMNGAAAAGSSSSSMPGMGRSSSSGLSTAAGTGATTTPGATAAGAGAVGTGARPAGTNPITTESGVSRKAPTGGPPGAPRRTAPMTPDTDPDTSADTEGTAGGMGRRRWLLAAGRHSMLAGRQTRSLLAAGLKSAQQVLTRRRLRVSLLQATPRTAGAAVAPTAAVSTRPAVMGPTAAMSSSRPSVVSVTPSGTLSSAVNVGAVGELQSFPNGISANKTLIALTRAGESKVPKEYVNRYGSFQGAQAPGGCLNCKAWGKVPQ